ncbi:MAG: NADH-quinone oxidoreductase subunit C [Paludibacteraceae bacterium]|nr:NADH-quinone oxidoreductase subunit D [Candidatus Physcocola equi]MCQ2234828.1 NADH-quinone oxidoreductase subunit C [Paludibacteraceae bacterium]
MEDINKKLAKAAPGKAVSEGTQYPTVELEPAELRGVAQALKDAGFDYLISLTGMDYGDAFGTIYHIASTDDPANVVVLKTKTTDRENPMLYSIMDIYESANLYEREVYDFFGIKFIGHNDLRRIFLRPDWNGFPFRKDDKSENSTPTRNITAEEMEEMPQITIGEDGKIKQSSKMLFGKNEYVVNFGPQHPATHGVLHLRVSLDGEIVKKIDPNFGYIHRGIEKMAESLTYPQVLPYTDRLDYLSGAINRHAFCLCVEKAAGIEVPMRAQIVRCIFDELTRVASHLLGWGCMAMDMGAITAFVYGMRDREKIMDIFEESAGGRLMPAYAVIGGLSQDIHPNFKNRVTEYIAYQRKMLKEHHILFTGNPIATGRMHKNGYLTKEKAIALGTGGPTGRASGWSCDVRKIEPYSAYKEIEFNEIIRNKDTKTGDTFDRYIIRLDEIEESLNIIEKLLVKLDDTKEGDFKAKVPAIIKLPAGDYFQRVENARGEFDVFISSDGNKNPYRVKFRSPCMTLISALDPICKDGKIADMIMIGASLDYVIPCADR